MQNAGVPDVAPTAGTISAELQIAARNAAKKVDRDCCNQSRVPDFAYSL